MISMIVGSVAVILVGLISAAIAFFVFVNLEIMMDPELSFMGLEGYEATGSTRLVLGALLGMLVAGKLILRTE